MPGARIFAESAASGHLVLEQEYSSKMQPGAMEVTVQFNCFAAQKTAAAKLTSDQQQPLCSELNIFHPRPPQ